jgi:hypothetical protein
MEYIYYEYMIERHDILTALIVVMLYLHGLEVSFINVVI